MVNGSNLKLEEIVWELVENIASYTSHEALLSLRNRLREYRYDKQDPVWDVTARGLESLRKSEDLAKITTVLLFGTVKRFTEKMEKGVADAYDQKNLKHPTLLKPGLRGLMDDIKMYANLLFLSRGQNESSQDALTYIDDIQSLVGVYHNLLVAEDEFATFGNYVAYKKAIEAIERARKDTKKTKSPLTRPNVVEILDISFATEAKILYQFANRNKELIQITPKDMDELEKRRLLIGTALKKSGLNKLFEPGTDSYNFYFVINNIKDYLTLPPASR